MPIYYWTTTDHLLSMDVRPEHWRRILDPATGRPLRVTPLVLVGDGAPGALYTEPTGASLLARIGEVGRRCPPGALLSWWVCSNLHPHTMVSWQDAAGRTQFLDNLRRMRTKAQEIRCGGIVFDAEDYARTIPPGGGPMDQSKAWLEEHLPPISAQDVARATAGRGLTVGYMVKRGEHWRRHGIGRSWLADWTRLYAAAARQMKARTIHLGEEYDIVVDPDFRKFLRRGRYDYFPGFKPLGLGDPPQDCWIYDQDQTLLREAVG